VTAHEFGGGEPRAADTATPPRPTSDAPTSQIHSHDDQGPFWVVTCTCTWASAEITDPVAVVYAQAFHDLEHDLEVAS
jgi:hypothetical protein